MANLDNTHITKLKDLINGAVDDIIAEYAAISHAVPSLDTVEPGPFLVPEAVPVWMRKAVQIIEAACAQLRCTVALPGSVLLDKALVIEEPACLQVVTEARIADLLLDKPKGLAASELADLSGLDKAKLTRILRFLATKHCFKEVANNRLSVRLLSSDTSSIIGLITDEGLSAASYFNEFLTSRSEAEDDSPFKRWSGHQLFEFYLIEQGRGRGKRFIRAMSAWGDATGKGFLSKVYPWQSKPKDTTICDDQPQVIEKARELWTTESPVAIEQGKVQFTPFDFLKDAAAEGCDFYYLRNILHNWRNTDCEVILNNIRKSMKPDSKLLLDEYVLMEPCRTLGGDSRDLDLAPTPLLPNYGAGRIRSYNMDILMMSLLGSQERTLNEFVALWCVIYPSIRMKFVILIGDLLILANSKKCGFEFSKLYEAGEMDLLEFTPI
ncbi:hypothetical protein D9757_013265 [Collybiopsis confluens]|uniref:O-methyltransferase n=1 Tax=Collybiopsis confluens TaxID=2823264 RepID=A0A8H5LQ79_9AGAR|nr:hypothetical protein D9757_012121 [Collybiopsis confluens]KAF5369250.1 hypothetical protein D9757_013265 [Collybiopsis confluens]